MRRPIFIAVNILLSLVLAILVLWPKYQDIQVLNGEIKKKNLELRYKKEYFSDLSETSKKLEKYEEALAKIDSALPSDSSIPLLFDSLQKISSQSGLVLKNISFSLSPSKEGNVKEITVPLSLSGSYSSFKNFLSVLEKSSRLFEVQLISFSPALKEKTTLFEFNLTAKVRSY